MLKKVIINHKEVPIPVPLKTLADAMAWVEGTLVKKDSTITKVTLQGSDVATWSEKQKKTSLLDAGSVLEFRIDSPRELAIQALDAVRDLAHEMVKRFRPLAVTCWQLQADTHLKELIEIIDDHKLMLDLIDHLNGMLDYTHADMAPINGLKRLIVRYVKPLDQARKQCDWKQCAHLLLNRMEGYLKELVVESENLQIRIFSNGLEELENQQVGAGA